MRDFKQHDVTDCGAACLAFIFYRYGLNMSISSIRQRTGTNTSGTTALGLVETAKECGFESKGIRCKFDDLRSVTHPGIAHVITEGGRQHYVVVCSIGKKTMKVMDPAVGRVEKWTNDKFRALWTNVFIVLAPSISFEPSKKKDGAWYRLIALLKPQKHVLTQAFVGVILGTILSLSTAIYIQKIVDNVIVDGNRNMLQLLGIAMIVILVIRILLGYLQSVLMLRSAQKIDAGLILGYYRHLMRLPQSFFDTMRVGEITSRVRDAVAVRDFLNGTILNLIINPLILIVALAAMFTYSWKLALYSIALIPAYVVIYLVSDWLNRRYQREIMERSADFDSQLVESLHAMSVVRSCGMEEEMSFRSETRLVRLLKRVWSAANTGFLVGSSGSFLTQAYSIGLLWIGASLVLDSRLTAGELMSCNALAGYITGPIIAIIGMNASIRTATTATDRLYEILDLEIEKDEGSGELEPEKEFDLVMENVNFRYPGRLATLKDVSLRFQSGKITALVGKSGCGKSTILSILQRHYTPDSGGILIGGVNIQYIKLASLRKNIAFVPQRIDLLAGSVLENLAPNETHPDMPRVIELCKRVGILEFIESLPRGFQTLITENGTNLSGGQKQRLAIVRALYTNAPIVMMDEPSSALDTASEDMLMDALQSMRKQGKLVILAVHNRRLLSLCDVMVELNDGQVISVREPDHTRVDNGKPSHNGVVHSDADNMSDNSLKETVDSMLTPETSALFQNLRARSAGGVLFGHDHANVMGIDEDGHGWFAQEGRCDVFAVTGKMPAVYGFDLGSFKNGWSPAYDYVVPKIREAYARGGVIVVSWFPDNLITGNNCAGGCAVEEVLPGSCAHKELRNCLDLIANNLGNLKDAQGRSIPIIFQCWHKQNEESFWWGCSRCTVEEYNRLFRFTVTYLREVHHVRNFLYAFSPGNHSSDFRHLMERYPGDELVDVLSLECECDESVEGQQRLLRLTREMVLYAESHGKVPALTHVGYDNGQNGKGLAFCMNNQWLKEYLINPIKQHPVACRIAYIMFADNMAYNPTIYRLPYPSSSHAECLAKLAEDPYLVFGDRVAQIYKHAVPAEATATV
jgi:ATP-binding cassette, subfamily C, bacteriocin exporter